MAFDCLDASGKIQAVPVNDEAYQHEKLMENNNVLRIVDPTVETADARFTDENTTQLELGLNSTSVLQLSSRIPKCDIVQLD